MLPGVDGRSSQARRFRDLCDEFAQHIAGAEKLSPFEVALVRQAAGLVVQAEVLQASIINGEPIGDDAAVRIANAATRVLGKLEARRRKREPFVPLRERLLREREAS
jgi:hypothetical protein